MSALDLITVASNDTFAGRVTIIAIKVAQNVASEDPATQAHAARVSYAGRVLRGDEKPKLIAAHVIASNLTIAANIEANAAALGSNIPDGDIEFALSSIWTARAQAFA
jgi:hypothetical protein